MSGTPAIDDFRLAVVSSACWTTPYGQMSMQGVDPLHGKRFFVRKRDGRRQEFNEARIYLAIESAFRATLGIEPNEALRDVLQLEIKNITIPLWSVF